MGSALFSEYSFQFGWFEYLATMPPGNFPNEVFQTCLTKRMSKSRPRTPCRDLSAALGMPWSLYRRTKEGGQGEGALGICTAPT